MGISDSNGGNKKGHRTNRCPFLRGAGGIRTREPVRANAFRVRPVMTASIRLHVEISPLNTYFIVRWGFWQELIFLKQKSKSISLQTVAKSS